LARTASFGEAAGSGDQPSGGRGQDASSASTFDRAAAAQAGGHLNQQALTRPADRPACSDESTRPPAQTTQEGFKPFGQPNSGNSQVKPCSKRSRGL